MGELKLVGYYVYADRRNVTGQPVFYIGKGFGVRFYEVLRPNKHWLSVVYKDKGFTRIIIKQGLTEAGAFALERQLIEKYGRKNLVNRTDGGDGLSGLVRTERHKKINAAHLIRINKGRAGKPVSEYVKHRVSESNKKRRGEKRKPLSKAWKEKISIAVRKSKQKLKCVE